MKAYCITLDQNNVQRAQTAKAEIERLGLACEFSPGIEVKQLDLDQLKDFLSPRAYIELKRGRQVHEALSGLGSVGCYLAHYNLWLKCANGQEPIAIFEDDVLFQADADQRFAQLMAEAEQNQYDVLRLIHFPLENVEPEIVSPNLKRAKRGYSTAAYVMTPKAAKLIVQHALPIEMHCDHYLDFICEQRGLNCYCPQQPIHVDRLLGSTIQHNGLLNSLTCPSWIGLFLASLIAAIMLIVLVIKNS